MSRAAGRRSPGAHIFPDPQPTKREPVKRKRGRPLPRFTPIEAVRRQLDTMWGSAKARAASGSDISSQRK